MAGASFLISPGVKLREIDQSQYASTTPGTANVAAIVGYTEKGPFEPTLVYGHDDFNQKFGYTLKDLPYLAQGAYKFFDQGQQLLVVRAGSSLDPSSAPNAAQHASKTVRIRDSHPAGSSTATAGYQTFHKSEDLLPSAYTAGETYTFVVLADQRAFKTPKAIVESWSGTTAETANEFGAPSPTTVSTDVVVKMAYDAVTATNFVANMKVDIHTSTDYTTEFSGFGARSAGSPILGTTIDIDLVEYRANDVYADALGETMSISGKYGAAVCGTSNLDGGHDWENTTQSFSVTIGSTTASIVLDATSADVDAVVDLINNKLASANLGTKLQAMKMKREAAKAYVALKHIGTGIETSFSLAVGTPDALATLGWAAGIYTDATCITGTWVCSTMVSNTPTTFNGDFVFGKVSTQTNALSFQDPITVEITAPASGSWTRTAMASSIQTALNSAYPAYNYPKARAFADATDGRVKITAMDGPAAGFASLVRISTGPGKDLVALLSGTDPVSDGGAQHQLGEAKVSLVAKEKGSYGNKLTLRVEVQSVRTGNTTLNYDNVYVLLGGKEVSAYPKVDWVNPTAPNYIVTKMANDLYVTFEDVDEDSDSTMTKLPVGDYTLGDDSLPDGVLESQAEVADFSVGSDGYASDSNGNVTSMSADLVNAIQKVANPEEFEFNLILAPGDASSVLQNAVQDLVDSRRDCFGIVDAAPFGLGLGIKAQTNQITEVNDACSTLNSSYVGAFWPWAQDYDSDNQQYVWLPPSIYALKAMVYTDNIADPWWAPAGLSRGKVSAVDIEYSANNTDRDILYGDGAIVNPIVKFVNEGISIWGQKTAQRTQSATDRINVRRLLIYAEKLIAKMARGFLFEPNDSSNWAAFARQANSILEPIRQRRGLYAFTVICDASTNTSDLVNQNIMAGKIFLQPTKTIEFITVDFTISATGALTVTEGK